jgi:hypothetical protein
MAGWRCQERPGRNIRRWRSEVPPQMSVRLESDRANAIQAFRQPHRSQMALARSVGASRTGKSSTVGSVRHAPRRCQAGRPRRTSSGESVPDGASMSQLADESVTAGSYGRPM